MSSKSVTIYNGTVYTLTAGTVTLAPNVSNNWTSGFPTTITVNSVPFPVPTITIPSNTSADFTQQIPYTEGGLIFAEVLGSWNQTTNNLFVAIQAYAPPTLGFTTSAFGSTGIFASLSVAPLPAATVTNMMDVPLIPGIPFTIATGVDCGQMFDLYTNQAVPTVRPTYVPLTQSTPNSILSYQVAGSNLDALNSIVLSIPAAKQDVSAASPIIDSASSGFVLTTEVDAQVNVYVNMYSNTPIVK